MHRLQIRPIAHNYRAPLPFPKLHPGPYSNVGMQRGRDTHRQTDRHTFRVIYESREIYEYTGLC